MSVEPKGPRLSKGTPPAKKSAAAVLEVLGGVRSPAQAAEALEISQQRYYLLETRAIEGLVAACEPAVKGPRKAPAKEIAKLHHEVERLKREVDRRQSLLRTAQRAIGLPAAKPKPEGKRKRRAVIRALVAAQVLRSAPETVEEIPAAAP